MTKMNVQVKMQFIPLPPEKRAAWENSMRLLGEMLLEIYAEGEVPAQKLVQNGMPAENTGNQSA